MRSDKQPKFSDRLSNNDPTNPTNTADAIRASVEIMVIAMIAEAAQPTDEFKTAFLKDLATEVRKKNRFPESKDFPKLSDISPKTGRSPAMDEIVRNGLEDVTRGKNFTARSVQLIFLHETEKGERQKAVLCCM